MTHNRKDILYISSVPVYEWMSGSTYMFRLFEGHEDNIIIYQDFEDTAKRKLTEAAYYFHHNLLNRLSNTRFRWLYNKFNYLRNKYTIPFRLQRIIKKEKPKVIVTVMHGLMWVLAWKVSRKLKLPLVIIVHDDIHAYHSYNRKSDKGILFLFEQAIKDASLRFVISDLMKNQYREKYALEFECLYPLQGKLINNSINTSSPGRFSFAYAGMLNSGIYVDMLCQLADALLGYDGILNVFSDIFPDKLKEKKNIIYKGFLNSDDLLIELNTSADVLFVPFAFFDNQFNIHLAFPSKIADYCLLNKPLFIWAPDHSAVVSWFNALENKPGLLLTENNPEKLPAFLHQFKNEINRYQFGLNTAEVGKIYFNQSKLQSFFFSKIGQLFYSY